MLHAKSPFPGMDPFVERHWRDFHHSLCTYASEALQPQSRPGLVARIDERLIEFPSIEDACACVYTTDDRAASVSTAEPDGATAPRPVILRILDEQFTEGFVHIIDAKSAQVVTVIEFMTPAIKRRGDARTSYRRRQNELRAQGVSLVEINLLRDGEWVMQVPPNMISADYRAPYCVVVHRGWRMLEFEYYPIPLDSRLPIIRVPLREQQADATLDLQSLFDRAYKNGAYDMLDYRQPLEPPLDEPWNAWARRILRGAGKL
jgi:hypothetical protein